jgi:hypothetical protein
MAIGFRARLVCGLPIGSNERRTRVEIGYSGDTYRLPGWEEKDKRAASIF